MAQQRGNIAEFSAGDGPALNLTDAGQAARQVSQAGSIEGQLYRQAGDDYKQAGASLGAAVEQHEFMDELSTGSAAWSAGFNNLTTQWNKAASQPGAAQDKNLQQSFMNDTVEPWVQQFQDSFTTEKGQMWATERADSLRQHLYVKTSADMSNLAAQGRMQDFTTTLNQIAGTAYKDPTSAYAAFDHIDSTLKAITDNADGQYTPEQIQEFDKMAFDMKNEVAVNTVKGLADNVSPDKARSVLGSGALDGHILPPQQEQLSKYIDNQAKARDVEKQQKAQMAEVDGTQKNTQEVQNVFSQLAQGKMYPATAAFSNPNLTVKQRNDFVAQNEGILNLPHSFLTSPAYGDDFGAVAQQVYNGRPITAEALTMGVRRQEVTPAGAVQLQQLQDKMKTPEGMAEINAQKQVLQQMQSQIVKGGPNASDPAGEKIYNSMLNTFYPAWDAAIKSGKTPAQLADPNSADYIGNMANTFKRSDTQALADVTSAKPAAPKVSLPPADQRKANTVYSTARGDMMWTGTGWVAPSAQAPKPE